MNTEIKLNQDIDNLALEMTNLMFSSPVLGRLVNSSPKRYFLYDKHDTYYLRVEVDELSYSYQLEQIDFQTDSFYLNGVVYSFEFIF